MPPHSPFHPVASARPVSRSVSRLVLALLVASGATARAKMRAPADGPPGRRIDRLVAGPSRLFALRGGEVVTFDSLGQPIGRCAGFAAPPWRETHGPVGGPDAEEVLQAAGLSDDDSSPAAEDALEDEGLGPSRRTRPAPVVGIVPHALAATSPGDAVWIATSSGIFRGDENGCATAGLSGRDIGLVASAGDLVLAASEDLLFRRQIEVSDSDGGGSGDDASAAATFTVAAGLASRPRALAVGPANEAFVADDDGVLIVSLDGTSTRVLDRATDAIAVCGGLTAVFSGDGVYTWHPGSSPVRVGDRPPARSLTCGRAPDERWIATGVGAWTSGDGSTWVERTEMLGRSVAGAAAVGERLWLAIDDQLVGLDATTSGEASSTVASSRIGASSGSDLPALPTRRLLAPTEPWPWVTALFGTERTPDRHAWTVMVLLTFPLGHIGRRVDSTALASTLVARDRALAVEQADLRAAALGDEVDARLEAVQQEREALR